MGLNQVTFVELGWLLDERQVKDFQKYTLIVILTWNIITLPALKMTFHHHQCKVSRILQRLSFSLRLCVDMFTLF